jgi:hypothetical protein
MTEGGTQENTKKIEEQITREKVRISKQTVYANRSGSKQDLKNRANKTNLTPEMTDKIMEIVIIEVNLAFIQRSIFQNSTA